MPIRLRDRAVPRVVRPLWHCLWLLLVVLLPLACGPADSRQRIILITIDSLRPDRLAAYGSPVSLMPHLDEMASEAVVFRQASTAAPLTFPALAGIMTGQPPSQVGVVDDRGSILSSRYPRLAPRLLSGNWSTGAFVNDPDLDTNCGLMEGFRRVFNPAAESRSRTTPASVLFDAAVDFLDHHRHIPSFAWIHVFDTHYPYLGPGVFGRGEARYNAALTAADTALGLFLNRLDRKNLLDDALLIVTADHGEGLGQEGEHTHGLRLDPTTIHVPLIIRRPGGATPGGRQAPVSLLDLAPTILEYAGLPPLKLASRLEGQSLLPLLDQDHPARERPLYSETFVPFFNYRWPVLRQVRTGQEIISGEETASGPRDWQFPPLPEGLDQVHPASPDLSHRLGLLKATSDILTALEESHLEEAEKRASDLVSQHPATPSCIRLLASVRRAEGKTKDALALLKTQAADPPSADLRIALASLQEELGQPSSAAWQQAADLSPLRIRLRVRQAEALAQEGEKEAAVDAARAALARDPDSAALNRALGHIFLLTGNLENALRMYAQAAVQAPGSSLTFRQLALAAMAAGNDKGALKMLDEALRIDPADLKISMIRGDLRARSGDMEAAKKAYRQALEPGLPEPESSVAVAEFFSHVGRYDAAQSILTGVLKDHPDNARAHYSQAQINLRQQQPAKAEQEFLAALKIGGEQPNIYYGLARAAALQSNDEKALAYLSRVFAADDPLLRRALRDDPVLSAAERSPQLRRAVTQYLTSATTEEETGTD